MSDSWTTEQMARRLVRYADLRPCRNAFVDTYTPGSDQKENFTIIGPGVAEHPDQFVHIDEPHGFNIGGARQPPGCTNSQHSHQSEEVFIVHSGEWAFRWGDHCQDGEAVLQAGDCISIPINVFRGFENVGEGVGYLFAVLGGDDAGHVLWAPDVFDKAADYGLILLENGRLVDTTRGETVPEGLRPMARTSRAQIEAHRVMSLEEMLECVCPEARQRDRAGSILSAHSLGVTESPIIGSDSPAQGMAAGKLNWLHGFQLQRLDFEPQGAIPLHRREEQEVLFLHSGELLYKWEGGELVLRAGDVLTVPIGLSHSFHSAVPSVAYVVRGGDQPAAPQFP